MRAMQNYSVRCSRPECGAPALYKVAAAWSDGTTRELKTYYHSCAGCLRDHFRAAGVKQRLCRLTAGETLDSPGVYELASGAADHALARRRDLEV